MLNYFSIGGKCYLLLLKVWGIEIRIHTHGSNLRYRYRYIVNCKNNIINFSDRNY